MDDGRYEARIFKDGRESALGVFDTELEAAVVYDLNAIAAQGDFAVRNFPELTEEDLSKIAPL